MDVLVDHARYFLVPDHTAVRHGVSVYPAVPPTFLRPKPYRLRCPGLPRSETSLGHSRPGISPCIQP